VPNIFGWHLFSILGVKELASGRAATLGFTMPIWTVLLAAAFFGQPLSRRALVGMACAGSAVALLVAHEITMLAGRPWVCCGCNWPRVVGAGHHPDAAHDAEAAHRDHHRVDDAGFGAGLLGRGAALEPAPIWQFSPHVGSADLGRRINYGVAQVIWFGLARSLPPQASTFALMAVPLVGTGLGRVAGARVPGWTDWVAAGFIMAAIASALMPARQRPGR
jgi:drug/metabolite transporter (DMT)-like permease